MAISTEQQLIDDILAQQLDLLRLSARERKEAIQTLDKLAKDLKRRLADEPELTELNRMKLNKVIRECQTIIGDYYKGLQFQTDLSAIANYTSKRTITELQVIIGEAALKRPLQDYLKSVASNVMIQGAPSADWWERQALTTQFKFKQELRIGMTNAETNQQIINRIVGNEKLGIPGVMDASKREAAALVQTSVQTVANDSRLNTFRANRKVISGVRQISTLDSHTSDICIAYSGAEWDLDGKPIGKSPAFNNGPPRHFNCRSALVPIMKLFENFQGSKRASDEGPIDAKTTFDDFLRRKGRGYQDETLGVGRADLWRRGKITLRDLVNGDGRPLSLEELIAKYN